MIAWLAHRLMPAAALDGSRGLPVPDPVEIAAVPDVVTRDFAMPAEVLYGLLLRVAAGQERTFLAAAYPTRLQAHFVARSAKLNLPSVIVAEAMPRGDGASVAAIHAASVYGWTDFGGNRKRIAAWVAALDVMAAGAPAADIAG